jgi:biotin carboxyl carrier protein
LEEKKMKKYLIKVNGTSYEVEVEEVRSSTHPTVALESVKPVSVPAVAPTLQHKETKTSAPNKAEKATGEGVSIASPMPGTILKLRVATGDHVKKGQVILILEAMKMENEIKASKEGVITAINVQKGSSVNAGDVLFTIS